MKKTIIVKTDAGDVTVKRLALGDYAELIQALKNLPEELAQLMDKQVDFQDTVQLFTILPPILAQSIPDFAAVLAATSDKDAKFFIEDCDLADSLNVLAAALELNSYAKVVEAIKKITGQPSPTPAPANSQPEA